jgi:pimeloyl-ACP methyl ester carboxylesterase
VVDAVRDVEDLLDHLGVTGFRALGWSGGGPHALACGALLPERCEAVATLAGVGPYGAHGLEFTAGMAESNVEEFGKAVAGEAELDGFLTPLLGEFQQITADTVAEGMADLASEVDRQAMTGALAEDIAVSFRRALASGIAGWRDDDLAFVRDWGFLPSKIAVPVAIWQGRQDRMVPFEHGQWLAAEIPNAQPHLFEEEGHSSLLARVVDLLADLITL